MRKKLTVNLRRKRVSMHLKTNLLRKKKKEEQKQLPAKRNNKLFDYLNKDAKRNK